jgi:hypothetical protein
VAVPPSLALDSMTVSAEQSSLTMIFSLSSSVNRVHVAISSRLRAQPRQQPSAPSWQSPVQGEANPVPVPAFKTEILSLVVASRGFTPDQALDSMVESHELDETRSNLGRWCRTRPLYLPSPRPGRKRLPTRKDSLSVRADKPSWSRWRSAPASCRW